MDNCMQLFKFHDIKSMRTKYWSKNPTERSQWLSDKLMEQANVDKSIRFLTERGIFVCQTAFIKIFNINKSVYYRKRRLFKQNVIAFSSITFRQRTTKYLTAMNWFEDYVTFHGDRMPHVSIVYLPYRTRKYVIFKQYRHEIDSALKRSTFYRMWTASFPHVKIKEVI